MILLYLILSLQKPTFSQKMSQAELEKAANCVACRFIWENISDNLNSYQSKINNLKTDVIVLPEMFTTGFTMEPEKVAEQMNGQTISWMKENSKSLDCAICGSIVIKENNKYFNKHWFEFILKFLVHFNSAHLHSYKEK